MMIRTLLLLATLWLGVFTASAGAAEAFTFLPDQTFAEADGEPLRFDFYQEAKPQAKQPLIIWLARDGKAARSKPIQAFDGRFPAPVASYLAYHYAIVSIDPVAPQNRDARLRELIDHLAENAERYHIDPANIGLIQPTAKGYEAKILRQSSPGRTPALPIPTPHDKDYQGLQAGFTTRLIVSYFAMHLHGGQYDSGVDPLALRAPDSTWVDPITATAPGTSYHRYATPSRAPGSFGSYLLYLPKSYAASARRYPVIYYLHGSGGSQREGLQLLRAMEDAMQRGEMPEAIVVFAQALPAGWYVNGRSGPVEDVLVRDLVPHIDASYRTIASAVGRGLEGWGMGGFGALRLAFKYPDTFAAASSLDGSLIDWSDAKDFASVADAFGPLDTGHRAASIASFNAEKPSTWAIQNADAIAARSRIRLLVGDRDRDFSREFGLMLSSLAIEHEYRTLAGSLTPDAIAQGKLAYPAGFWREAFRSAD